MCKDCQYCVLKYNCREYKKAQNGTRMATQKKRVVFYVDEEIKEKLSELAANDRRSLSNWLENLAIKTIEDTGENNKVASAA